MSDYAELHCLSDFSFGRGASNAAELFERAKACGYRALAITDECSLAGIVRAYQASNETGLKLIVGAEFQLEDGPKLVLLCENRQGYVELCRLITRGRRASEKGTYRLVCADLHGGLPGTLALWMPQPQPDIAHGRWMRATFGDRAWLAVELHRGPDDAGRLRELQALGRALGLPLVASGDVHMHVRRRLALQHTLTAIRHRVPIAEAGALIFRNGERHLRRRDALADIYPEALMQESVRIAERCAFKMGELKYDYPTELVPQGHTPTSWLRQLAEEGIRWRWPQGVSDKVRKLVEDELALIASKKYEAFFLTVHDIVRFARSKGILCQGRGSAANSAVCFALGVTEVDPAGQPSAGGALHQRRPRRATRHRCRFRTRAARGGHPVHLPEIRARACRAGRHRDLLPRPQRGARRGQGARPAAGPGRPAQRCLCARLGRQHGRRTVARTGFRSGQPDPPSRVETHPRVARHAAAPVATRRRLRDLQYLAERDGAGGKRGHARAHRHPVGEGRSGLHAHAESRLPGAGHADLSAQMLRAAGKRAWGRQDHRDDQAG